MKKIIILAVCLILCGCSDNKNSIKTKDKELQKILDKNEYVIVDVRSKMEYNGSHVVDAINIPHNEIDENVNLDKEKTILVYCMSGTRSAAAYDILVNLGYDVYDLGAFSEIDLPKQ